MNRFRTKKKAKEAENLVTASTESDGPSVPPIKSSKTFRRGKKSQEPEPKIEIDLATALPSSDDFRTSLLMSGLSARFSMLREQDDPKSKIGKASDDSVLFPKRQSKLNDFGFQSHGLSDIAEVSSINGSVRPPFAFGRTDSYHASDGYGTDDDSTHAGSIMNRAKPGEGNNLFGGRQKIYKIPVNASGSSKSLADGAAGGMGGRALYENDVSQSAFQRLREREREQERLERQEREEIEAQSSRPSSPPPSGYNRNRETSSTTSSAGPSNTRTSTAATSFTSQRTPSLSGAHTPVTPGLPMSGLPGLERSTTKGRRLYETGLDQHLHEQQFSAMSRIDTLTRQRTLGAQTPPLGLSPTGGSHPSERWERHQIAGKASMPNLRAASPPPTGAALGTFDFAIRQNNHTTESKPFGMTAPPLSPPMSEHDDSIVLALQPNDMGKATALGAFQKPAQPYDENKYSQRQLQMQQGRETPPPRKHSPPRAFASRQQQQQVNRARADSSATFASGRSRSNSSVQRHFLPQDSIPETLKAEASVPQNESTVGGTFLSSPNGSSQDSVNGTAPSAGEPKAILRPFELYARYRQDQPLNLERPPESEHPANRQQINPHTSNGLTVSNIQLSTATLQPSSSSNPPADSPTLGPAAGLSGMVRQHLRAESNSSSIYGGVPSAGIMSRFPIDPTEPLPQNEYTIKTNPWESDEWDHDYYTDTRFGHEAPVDVFGTDELLSAPLSARSPNIEITGQSTGKAAWERDMETHHTRDGSSETQRERQDFQNELATRRRRVQENLKSFVETENRSVSPIPVSDWSKETMPVKTNALGLPKTKSSRGSLIGRTKEPGQTKAMKMLGIGNATMTSSPSPGKKSFEDNNPWQQEEEEMWRGVVKAPTTPPQTRAFRQARRDAQRDRERQVAMRHQQNQQRIAAESNEAEWSNPREGNQPSQRVPNSDRVPPNIRTGPRNQSRERRQHPPPVTHSLHATSGRDSKDSVGTARSGSRPPSRASRSGSDTSGGRSKSRNGRYRDDLAKAMAEGMSSSSQGYHEDLEVPSARLAPKSPATPGMVFSQSPVPSPMIGSNSRSRSNSNLAAGYFDGQKSPMLQTGSEVIEIGLAPRPSPTAPFVVNPTPALVQPSPAGSGANTPTGQVFQNQGRAPTIRKRSINKSDISEPRFISSTSRVTTVDLPPGSSLQNGSEFYAPPIPPVNPRRRQTRAIFGTLMGKKDEYDEVHSMPSATQSTEEMSTFSADESESKPKIRQKLRKSSSEGGNLNARARQAMLAAPSPAVPSFPTGSGSPPRLSEGGMF